MAFNKQSYNDAYNKAKYSTVSFRINKKDDQKILEHLKAQPKLKEYICGLIIKDMQRLERRSGYVRSKADRKAHLNYQKYEYEVIEAIGINDRYTVGFAESYEAAQALAISYIGQHQTTGPLTIYQRFYDDTVKAHVAIACDMAMLTPAEAE